MNLLLGMIVTNVLGSLCIINKIIRQCGALVVIEIQLHPEWSPVIVSVVYHSMVRLGVG